MPPQCTRPTALFPSHSSTLRSGVSGPPGLPSPPHCSRVHKLLDIGLRLLAVAREVPGHIEDEEEQRDPDQHEPGRPAPARGVRREVLARHFVGFGLVVAGSLMQAGRVVVEFG